MITNYITAEFKPLYAPFDYSFPPCKEYIPRLPLQEDAENLLAPELCKDTSPVYRDIVFFQESDADEFIEMLNNVGEAALIKYLADYYDYGSGARHKVPHWGSNDRVFKDGHYVLSVNFYIPYIALHSVE